MGAFLININNVSADITNVSVTPQIDSGDTDKFEMIVKPGDKRSLTIAFTNFGSAVERLKIQPTNAQTDASGNFIYRNVVKKGSNGLAAAFANMTTNKKIVLQPQQSKTITLVVNTPKDNFDGVIYGGFNIYSINAQGQKLNDESTNIPVIITQTNQNVSGQGKIIGIKPQAIAYQPNIVIQLQNSKPGEAKNVAYNLMIQRKGIFSFLGFNGRKVPVYQSDLTIAPNSILPIPVNFKQQPLKEGKYMVTGSFTINGKTKKVNKTYSLSKGAVEEVNKQSKGLIYDKTWIFVLIIVGLILLILIVIILIVRQIRSNRRQENQEMLNNNEKLETNNSINPNLQQQPASLGRNNYGQSNVNQFKNFQDNSFNQQNPNLNANNFVASHPNFQSNSNNQPVNPNSNYGVQPNFNNYTNPNYQQPQQPQQPNFNVTSNLNSQFTNGNQIPNNFQPFSPDQQNQGMQGSYMQPQSKVNNGGQAPNGNGPGRPNSMNYYSQNNSLNDPNQINPQQNASNSSIYNQPNEMNNSMFNNQSVASNKSDNQINSSLSSSDSNNGSNKNKSNDTDDEWDQISIDDLLKKH